MGPTVWSFRTDEDRPLVETNGEIAKIAGRLSGRLRRERKQVGPSDVLIGAAEVFHDEPVVTGNPGDLERIPGVAVETYP